MRQGCEGPLNAKVAFVGEAWGQLEEIQKRPFVGRSGEELNGWLQSASIKRNAVWLGNGLCLHPQKNDLGQFVNLSPTKTKPVSSAPNYEMWLAGVTALKDELARLSELNLVVAVGQAALYALTGIFGIEKYRGSILECELANGRKVKCIPIKHPSNVVRGDYLCRAISKRDMRRVAGDAMFPEKRLPLRALDTLRNMADVRHEIELLQGCASLVAFDLEAINDEISHISLSGSSESAISIPFLEPWRNVWTVEDECEIWQLVSNLLRTKRCMAKNAMYDKYMLYRKLGILANVVEDPEIMQSLAHPDLPKDLGFLTSVYSREPYYKDEGAAAIKGRGGMWDAERFARYNALDAAVLHDILPGLLNDLMCFGNLEVYRREMRMLDPLVYLQARGIKVDLRERDRLSVKWRAEETRLLSEVDGVVGEPGLLNPNSHPQCVAYFYGEKVYRQAFAKQVAKKDPSDKIKHLWSLSNRYPPYKTKGKVTVDEDSLVRLAAKGDRAATLLVDAREARKAYSTFIEAQLGDDNRIRSSMSPDTVSGRLSSSKFLWGEGMDTQNFPKGMRTMWVADDGYAAYSVDLAGADNRCVAYFANERKQIAAFESGQDLHRLTASLLSRALWGQYVPPDEIDKTQRARGKSANHGLNYGMGSGRAALEWRVPESEAKRIVDAYHSAYPAIRGVFHRDVQAQMGSTRMLLNPMGRHRYFLGRYGEQTFKDGYNWMAQSTVADTINFRGLVPMFYERAFEPAELLNQVHDEIMFQIPLSVPWLTHARILLALKASLELPIVYAGRKFYLPAEMKIGRNFGPDGMVEVDVHQTLPTLVLELQRAWHQSQRLREGP